MRNFVTAALLISLVGGASGLPPSEVHHDPVVERFLSSQIQSIGLFPGQSEQDRKTCHDYYPGHEQALAGAHNCTEIGASACGGPDQCSCPQNARLVSWRCDEGTFNACSSDKDGAQRCP